VTDRERVEALLAGGVPDLVAQDAVLEAALLGQERGADRGLLVGLKVVRDLGRDGSLDGLRGNGDDDSRIGARRTTCPRRPRLQTKSGAVRGGLGAWRARDTVRGKGYQVWAGDRRT
jgi:hypothetical protein